MSFEHVFDAMELGAEPFALCTLHGRCTLPLGRPAGTTLQYILGGRGEIRIPDRPALRVGPGSLVLMPALMPHALHGAGEPGPPLPDCRPAEVELVEHIGGEPADAGAGSLRAICSHVQVALRGTSGLVDLIRQPIVLDVAEDAVVAGTVERLLAELAAPGLGSRAMIRALLLQCMIQLIRRRLAARDRALEWMAALADERLWAALRRMLDAPGAAHSVEGLAREAGMSRASFARHFAAAYGSGPMELLRELRMRHAADLLANSGLPVKRIAEQAGFASRSAFARAFTQHSGVSPRGFRGGIDGEAG
ncbi:AraC family transcriptional regulator [Limibaculum sp. FT325]|uniref:AraC family transcriptional regulator n=1 Tax=Thermohalobaculum sediminis TaxID=2939436 RepID=UPI0020C076BD|nr:AraC family transcriptional regulator [Limibaculum sediminis]MCL5777393.1 AraC family transcriptional regulator [Limibaculum sediminis]